MTRETKIGLIVAGSFLCLVCVVVASKWRPGDDKEPEEQTIQVAAGKSTPNGSTAEPKKNDPAPKKDAEPKKSAPVTELPKPPLMVVPPGGEVTLPSAPPLLPQLPTGEFKPLGGVEPKIELPSAPPKGPGTGGDGGFPPLKPLAPVEEKQPGVETPPLISLPPNVGVSLEPKPAPKLDLPPAALPFSEKDQPPAFPPLTAKNTLPSAPPEVPKEKPKEGGFVFPPLPAGKDGPPLAPPLGTPTPLPKSDIPAPPNFTLPKDPPTVPPLVDLTPKPIPKIPASDLPSVPPLGVGGNKPLPAVRDVSTDPYVCVAGDTSFAVLSKRFYGTEKYADALRAYNQEHAKWIKNGQALLTNPPTLQPGQNVEQPPASILERSYKAWIRETDGSTVPTIPSVTPSIKPPVTLGKPPGVATVSIPPTVAKGGTYKVQSPNGESVFDVAERTLGNRSLWPEIWRVNQTNPAVRPPAPIPFGTELKLP